ncbi:MAG: YceI family protein [Bacteroidota bacterium]
MPITKTKWVIDPVHSEIAFKVKHLMISNVHGSFKKFDASVYTNGNDFKDADIDFWIDPASIDTNNEDRDKHLRSAEFFDVKNYDKITFSGTLEDTEKDADYELWGDLTVRGKTHRIKLDVEFGGFIKDPSGNEKAGFTISGNINRKDLGLTWNAIVAGGGVMVSEEVKIICEVELQKVNQENLKIRSMVKETETETESAVPI